jgi:hypothetical protein
MTQPVSRREFLKATALGVGAALLPLPAFAAPRGRAERCLVINLIGGPSQLETWDPKPDAPSHVRGPFGSIPTSVPGVRFSELFPRIASQAHRLTVIRSVYHDAAPIHETGLQLLQTGQLSTPDDPASPWFAVARRPASFKAVLVNPILSLGVPTDHGQTGAFALSWSGKRPDADRYGRHRFGELLSVARSYFDDDSSEPFRFVTVNLFSALADQVTWDCHADGYCHNSTVDDYRTTLGPAFDQAFSALLDDLSQKGMLDSTLVVAQGEFGRTPHVNDRGGRDHWPGCWSILMAGGGLEGGQVIGSSDSLAAEPRDRPVHAREIFATILSALGRD